MTRDNTKRFVRTRDIGPPVATLVAMLVLLAGCGRAGENVSREVLRAIDQGKVTGTKGTMETLSRALSAYAIDRGGYPRGSSIRDAVAALTPAFLVSPVGADEWGNPFGYQSDTRSFTITSAGADGRVGTADDIVLADGRFTYLPAPVPQ